MESPKTANYAMGVAVVIFNGIDLGSIVRFKIIPNDDDPSRLTFHVTLDEHSPETYAVFFDGPVGPLHIKYSDECGVIWSFSRERFYGFWGWV